MCFLRDCGIFVCAYVEELSDGIPLQAVKIDVEYLHMRYAALLWKYGLDKAKEGYKSENDDPPRQRCYHTPPDKDKLVNVG